MTMMDITEPRKSWRSKITWGWGTAMRRLGVPSKIKKPLMLLSFC